MNGILALRLPGLQFNREIQSKRISNSTGKTTLSPITYTKTKFYIS